MLVSRFKVFVAPPGCVDLFISHFTVKINLRSGLVLLN